MKKFVLIPLLVLVIITIFATSAHCRTTVFFVGGWGMTPSQMDSFSKTIPETRKVKFLLPQSVSDLARPWYCADLIYEQLKKNNLLEDDLYFVAFSLGGVVTQWLLREHPELHARKLVLVGTPIGGYKFLPNNPLFSNEFPRDLSIYVIAGSKSRNAWFLSDDNDGVVDLESALNIRAENLKDFEVFNADHNELEELPCVQELIAQWLDLEQEAPRNIFAGNAAFSKPSQGLRNLMDQSLAFPN